MQPSGLAGTFDLAQIALYVFWAFFACLIYYLRSEDKREGYPLRDENADRVPREGFPPLPKPKRFLLPDGRIVYSPRIEAPSGPGKASPMGIWPGSPLRPDGDPMIDGVGPASYVARADHPDPTPDGHPKIVPLRVVPAYSLAAEGPDPRGMAVRALDGIVAGRVCDAWIDLSEFLVRYLEIEVANNGGRVLLPMTLSRIDDAAGEVAVASVKAHHFATAPKIANPEQVTLREEDRICAYFASGHLYATPQRSEPLI